MPDSDLHGFEKHKFRVHSWNGMPAPHLLISNGTADPKNALGAEVKRANLASHDIGYQRV
jgi:hypothetical protein